MHQIAATITALSLTASLACQDIPSMFSRLNPSVVTIQTTEFKILEGQVHSSQSLGSGVIIDKSGLIFTAAHVVDAANEISVKLNNGSVLEAEILRSVPAADVALIKLIEPPEDLTVAELGDSDQVRIGDRILVIGAPFGLEHSLSIGYVSGKMQRGHVLNGEMVGFIQTDAAINHGNSGGPMFNEQGQVIGIVSFIFSEGGGFDGIGFGVDINSTERVLMHEIAFWTGFDGIFLDPTLAGILNVPQASGVLVQRVTSGSFAEKIGLKGGFFQSELLGQKLWLGGDIILSIQGVSCVSPHDLNDIKIQIEALKSDEPVIFSVLRNGMVIELDNVIQSNH